MRKIGAEPLKGKRDFEKAKQLVKEAGYKGEKIVIIDATDQPIVHSQSLLTLEMLKKIGLNAEIQAGDWGTLITRRAVKGAGRQRRLVDLPYLAGRSRHGQLRRSTSRSAAPARRRWFGWPTDPKMEELRESLVQRDRCRELEEGGRCGAEARVRVRALSSRPAQFILPTAYRSNISGLIIAPINLLWNVEKK